jgi:polygalacturonase
MTLSLLLATPRSATFEISNGHPFRAPGLQRALLDGAPAYEGERNVFTVEGLAPGQPYSLGLDASQSQAACNFRTAWESCWLDVRALGAQGDGRTDDTAALQAAISSCPAGGTVVLPRGDWLSGPLFLKSDVDLYLDRGARLLGHPDIERWPVLPAVVSNREGTRKTFLGSWEGEPADCHAGLLTGIHVSNVRIHGAGCIDGNASFDTWWSRPKSPFRGWRPRTVFLVGCRSIALAGLALRNSPSWTIHPLHCRGVSCLDLLIEQPPDSPNTDGINPESCEDVRIAGVRFSTGDDCIAVKSGKVTRNGHAPVPARGVTITNCRMERGHGAIVIGSEMSGGVYDVLARDCEFIGTDRGLRIKTRRGRGPHAIVDGIRMQNVSMRGVGTPLVVNSFYCCPGDAGLAEIDDRAARPVGENTPTLRNVHIADVACEGVAHSAGYVLGLPERPLENLLIARYRVRYDPAAQAGCPDMARSIAPALHEGFYLCNVRRAVLTDVDVEGASGPVIVRENVT